MGEAIATSDSGDLRDWSASTPVGKRGETRGKGSSNCSTGGGCTYCGGKGVLFVFVFFEGRGKFEHRGRRKGKGWGGGRRGIVRGSRIGEN
jgi:hypothetical protein